jgi:hypothetical protein
MGGAEVFQPMSDHRYQSTLLTCTHCDALGAITWNLQFREANRDNSFVRLSGDFQTQAGPIKAEELAVVCTQCDAIYGPLPIDSGL